MAIYIGGTGSANELDDYEEGSWTPSFDGATNGSLANQYAYYQKVGNQVIAEYYISNTSFDSTSAVFRIAGYPFASASGKYGGGMIAYSHNANYSYPITPLMTSGDAKSYFHRQDGTTAAWLYSDARNTNFPDGGGGGQLIVRMCYQTS